MAVVKRPRSVSRLPAAGGGAAARLVSREQLVIRVRGQARALPLARSIDGHVRALRRKLGDDATQPRLLQSVRGLGYRLSDAPEPPRVIDAPAEAILMLDEHRQVKFMNATA
jgi:DNA-binding winged helix-turn-helix (wHTH) protein